MSESLNEATKNAVEVLHDLGACAGAGDAIPWVLETAPLADLGRSGEALWNMCERGDWLIWLVSHKKVRGRLLDSNQRLRLIACDCAESVLPRFESAYPDDARPREAIAISRRYAVGNATLAKLAVAESAAESAARIAAKAAEPANAPADALAAECAAWAAVDAAWASDETAPAATWAANDAARSVRGTADECVGAVAGVVADVAAERARQAGFLRARYRWAEVRSALVEGAN